MPFKEYIRPSVKNVLYATSLRLFITYFCFVKSKLIVALSLYLLMLAVYPCTDGKTCVDDIRTHGSERNFRVDTTDHDHSESETDLCTPFCNCSCCATTFRLTVNELILFSVAHNTILTVPYSVGPLLRNPHAIWQPPKLS